MAVTTKSKNAQQVSSAKVLHAAVVLVFTNKHMFFFFIGTTGKKPWTYKGDISGFYFMVSRVILMVFIYRWDISWVEILIINTDEL